MNFERKIDFCAKANAYFIANIIASAYSSCSRKRPSILMSSIQIVAPGPALATSSRAQSPAVCIAVLMQRQNSKAWTTTPGQACSQS